MRHSIPLLALFLAAALSPFVARSQPIHQGTLAGKQNSGPLSVSLSKDQTVSYSVELSSSYYWGASAKVEGFNHKGALLFTRSAYTGTAGNVITVTLPAGFGHLVPYRGTAHQVGRPTYLVVTSLNEPVTYSIFESKDDRQDYNEGGLSMGEATTIALYETVKGNVHEIEGNEVSPGDRPSPGGQWFKVTLEPRQTIRPHGWALGHPTNGAAFNIRIYDESGAYLKTIANVTAYGLVAFPNAQGLGSSVYQNTAAEPKTFYVQVYSKLFITHDFEFSLVEVMMHLEAEDPIINRTNGYSEDRLLHLQAVRGDTYAPLDDFSGSVNIQEVGDETIYDKNWGSLPSVITIQSGSGGRATFLVQSRVGPREGRGRGERWPLDAQIAVIGFRMPGRVLFAIPQWVCTESSRIHDLSRGCVPDWMQLRLKDVASNANLSDADREALDAVESYTALDLGPGVPGGVAHATMRTPKVPIMLNPAASNAMRVDGRDPNSVCGQPGSFHLLTAAFFHEARHAYQGSVASIGTNDLDDDLLVITPYIHHPSTSVIDSTSERQVCDPNVAQQYQLSSPKDRWKYQGGASADTLENPDYAVWGLEMDAYQFGSIIRTQ